VIKLEPRIHQPRLDKTDPFSSLGHLRATLSRFIADLATNRRDENVV
jgi:hypothetical protein